MTTPPRQAKKSSMSPSQAVRQSPQHQHGQDKQELPQGREMSFFPTYVFPLRHEAPKIQLSAKAKYLVSLPPMSEDVEEEGSLLGYVNDLKYQDYNLLDHINFPQFQVDQYMSMTVSQTMKVEALTP